MRKYRVLNQQQFTEGEFSLVPIRRKDRFKIMKWRNEQMYHLRQKELLTAQDQNKYFEETVAALFEMERPDQILFSYLKNGECMGYGGLVHINWIDKNAEVSFIMKTSLEMDHFNFHWSRYLLLLEKVAHNELGLHKIYTYAFDLREHLYKAIEDNSFKKEAVLKEHCFFHGKFIDVVLHSRIFGAIRLRKAENTDLEITYKWVNDSSVRAFSYNRQEVDKKSHTTWFLSKLQESSCEYYILEENGKPAGSIRFDIFQGRAKINYLIDPAFMGKGLGTTILKKGLAFLKVTRPDIEQVYGFVLKSNKASIRIFEKLDFQKSVEGSDELKYKKQLK